MEIAPEAIDKIMEEIKDINARAINHMRTAGLEQIKQLQAHFDEKIQELNRQNDGLLGAIGRLQGEREEAVKKLEEHKAKEQDRDHHFRMQAREMEMRLEEDRQNTRVEIDGYKRQIAELQAKLKKQTKK